MIEFYEIIRKYYFIIKSFFNKIKLISKNQVNIVLFKKLI